MLVGGSRSTVTDATMQQAIEELQNILNELMLKVNEEGIIHLHPDDISALQMVTATVMGMPTDYPDAAAQTTLTAIQGVLSGVLTATINNFPADYPDADALAQLVEANATLNSILADTEFSGLVLDDILTALQGTLTVQGSGVFHVDDNGGSLTVDDGGLSLTIDGTVAVSNFPTSFEISNDVGNTIPVVDAQLHTDLGDAATSAPFGSGVLGWLRGIYARLNDKTQYTRLTDATNDVSVVAGADSGQAGLLIAPGRMQFTANLTGTEQTPSVDASNYVWGSIHVLTVSSSNIGVQQSNNGTNWVNVVFTVGTSISQSSTNITTAGIIYAFPILGRYIRISHSGTSCTSIVELYTSAAPFAVSNVFASQQGTWTVQPGNTANTTAWLITDRGATATVTSPAMSSASATLVSSANNRKEVIIANRTGQILYVRFGSGAASSTDYTLLLNPNDVHIEDKYTGQMTAIMASGSGNAQVTEVT